MSGARKIGLCVTAATLAALFVRLGFWQLERREQRVATVRAVDERGALPVLDWTAASSDPAVIPADTTGTVWRRVKVAGRYARADEIILRGRVQGGTPGVELLTPLRTAAGALLVLRGFLPAADGLRPDLAAGWPGRVREAARAAESGESISAIVEGTLLPSRPGRAGAPIELSIGGREHLVLAGADIDVIRRRLGYPVLPFVIRAAEDGLAAPGLGPPRELDRDTGPHLSYAIQWFAFAGIAIVGTALLVRREDRRAVDGRPAAPRRSGQEERDGIPTLRG